jgi:hypothetical protein
MPNIQKKILKTLAERPAIPLDFFKTQNTETGVSPTNTSEHEEKNQKVNYAFTRALKNLVSSENAEIYNSDNQKYVSITRQGKNKLNSIILQNEDTLVDTHWDGLWRIIILDLPEERKSEREALRYLLKKAGFVCAKNTVWISHLPYEHLFTNIKKDLGLSNELMILVTNKLDPATQEIFFKAYYS